MTDIWSRFEGTLDGGFKPYDKDRWQRTLRSLKGKKIEVCIREAVPDRTLPQNAKLHVIAREIAEHSGHTLAEIKEIATIEALGVEVATRASARDPQVRILRGTSDLTKDECSLVMDWLLDLAASLDVREPAWDSVEVL